ncbi:MAG TPA: N-acetylmuramoyl-L-alanine amidase [Trebonia sp.]
MVASRRGGRARSTGGLLALASAAIVISGCSSLFGLSSGSSPSNGTPIASASSTSAAPAATSKETEDSRGSAIPRSSAVPSAASLPLAGKIVGVDPGHNGGNFTDTAYIGHLIWNGREWEACNTTGTATDAGYTEAQFNFNVGSYLHADLIADGARVVMTRTSNEGVGPCVNKRAAIINAAHANVGIAIHADGAAPSGRGFAILVPVADGPNDKIIGASAKFADDLRATMLAGTPLPISNYDGVDAIQPRDNLAGLNLVQVPMVLIEVGNMRNATDAALQITPAFQQKVAKAILAAILKFLT